MCPLQGGLLATYLPWLTDFLSFLSYDPSPANCLCNLLFVLRETMTLGIGLDKQETL